MNITYQDKELDVFEDEEDPYTSGGMFNFCETLAGNTLTINTEEYDVKKVDDFDGIFVLTKKPSAHKVNNVKENKENGKN